jgi:hypothetical protein
LSRLSSQSITGLVVLAAGLLVVLEVTTGAREPEPEPEPVVTVAPEVAVPEAPPPSVPGVPPEVQRVLFASGNAERLGLDQLTELPPEVARVLIQYGMTLTIATDRGGEG